MMSTTLLLAAVVFAGTVEMNAVHLEKSQKTIDKDVAVNALCPVGFTAVYQYCYLVNPAWGIFQQHLDFCYAHGGYMAVIETAEENSHLLTHISNLQLKQCHLFIGYYDFLKDNKGYYWMFHNHPRKFINWKSGSPAEETWDCTVFNSCGQDFGLWTDRNCFSYNGAICEADPL